MFTALLPRHLERSFRTRTQFKVCCILTASFGAFFPDTPSTCPPLLPPGPARPGWARPGPGGQPASQPAGRSAGRPASQPACHPASHPAGSVKIRELPPAWHAGAGACLGGGFILCEACPSAACFLGQLENVYLGIRGAGGRVENCVFCMLSRDLSAPGGRNAHFMLIPAPAGVFRRRPPRFSRESEDFLHCSRATEAAKHLFRGHSDWRYAGDWGNAGGPFPAPPAAVLDKCANISFAFPRFLSHSLCITRRNSLFARKWIF